MKIMYMNLTALIGIIIGLSLEAISGSVQNDLMKSIRKYADAIEENDLDKIEQAKNEIENVKLEEKEENAKIMAVINSSPMMKRSTVAMVNGALYRYNFIYVTYISKEPQNELQPSEANVHICQLEKEKKLKICKEALLEQFALEHEINLIDNIPVLREQLYEIKKSGFEYAGQSPVKVKACMCPTNPPLYLDDNLSGEDVNIYVSLRDNYADIVGAFPDDE